MKEYCDISNVEHKKKLMNVWEIKPCQFHYKSQLLVAFQHAGTIYNTSKFDLKSLRNMRMKLSTFCGSYLIFVSLFIFSVRDQCNKKIKDGLL